MGGTGTDEATPHWRTYASLVENVRAVCASEVATGPLCFGRCGHVRLARGLPPLTAAVT